MPTTDKYDDVTCLRLPPGTTDIVRKLAAHKGVKPSDVFRQAIANALKPMVEEMERDIANGAPPPADTPRETRAVSSGDTRAAMFRRLITEGKLTDRQILKAVEKKFNRRVPSSSVNYYRADIKRRTGVAKLQGIIPSKKATAGAE